MSNTFFGRGAGIIAKCQALGPQHLAVFRAFTAFAGPRASCGLTVARPAHPQAQPTAPPPPAPNPVAAPRGRRRPPASARPARPCRSSRCASAGRPTSKARRRPASPPTTPGCSCRWPPVVCSRSDAEHGAALWRADVTTTVPSRRRPTTTSTSSAATPCRRSRRRRDGPSGGCPLAAAVSAPLVARSGWVIAALETGDVLALRGADGTEVWRQTLGAAVVTSPAIDGDRLYLPGADGMVRALDRQHRDRHLDTGARRQHRLDRPARRARVRRLDRQLLLLPG